MITRKHIKLLCFVGMLLLLAFLARLPQAEAERRLTEAQDLSQQAYAILKKNCMGCHGAAKTSGLDLRTGEGLLAGGENGPVLIPSDAEGSKLFQLVTHELKPKMPPGKKLADADIDLLRRWIDAGASFDGFEKTAAVAADRKDNPDRSKLEERAITLEERRYWAFQTQKRVTPPRIRVSNGQLGWTKNPIDAFLF